MKQKDNGYGFRKKKDFRLLNTFTYKGISGLDIFHIELYDYKLKKVFVGNINTSTWTLKEKLESMKPKKKCKLCKRELI